MQELSHSFVLLNQSWSATCPPPISWQDISCHGDETTTRTPPRSHTETWARCSRHSPFLCSFWLPSNVLLQVLKFIKNRKLAFNFFFPIARGEAEVFYFWTLCISFLYECRTKFYSIRVLVLVINQPLDMPWMWESHHRPVLQGSRWVWASGFQIRGLSPGAPEKLHRATVWSVRWSVRVADGTSDSPVSAAGGLEQLFCFVDTLCPLVENESHSKSASPPFGLHPSERFFRR